MSRTLTSSDRSALIRLASTLPTGDETRRAILAGLRCAALGKHVTLKGIVEGYTEGPTRELHMFGPLVPVAAWKKAMWEGLSPGEEYSDFRVSTVARWLTEVGVAAVHPARELSVAIYFPLPPGLDVAEELGGHPAHAAEVSTKLGKPDGPVLDANWVSKSFAKTEAALAAGQQVWVRMWWD
jgi:hypothetical protein